MLISEPVLSGAALARGTEDLAYISASPGTVPDGVSATITNLTYIAARPGTFPDAISAAITNLASGEAVTVAGRSKSAALAGAQRELLRENTHAHPFYWAAFVSTGGIQ